MSFQASVMSSRHVDSADGEGEEVGRFATMGIEVSDQFTLCILS